MASIKFYLNPRPRIDGTHALKLSIHLNNTTMRKDVGIEIPKKLWDSAKQQIVGDYNGIAKLALNNALQKHKIKATDKLFQLSQSGEIASTTAKQFCKELYNSCPISTKLSFNQYFEEYIQRLFDTGNIGNANSYQCAYNSFKRFCTDELSFDEVTYVLIKKYDENLIKQGLSMNGRSTYHRSIRALYNNAIKELDYVERFSNPYLDFHVQNGKTKKRNISLDEVRSIYNYSGDNQLARDMFMMSFFCIGMDIVDICHLKHENIEKGRLIYARKKVTKTQRIISIKITPEIQSIIDKYKGKTYLFPFLEHCTSLSDRYVKHTNARRLINKKLKNIQNELEIDLDLTTKVSRHSWATIALQMKYSKDLISEMLGHKSPALSVTEIYLAEIENAVKDECNQKVIENVVSPIVSQS